MAYKVILHRRAQADIDEAFIYIADCNLDAGVRWYRQVRAEIRGLSQMPSRCAKAPESDKFGHDLKQLIIGKRTGRYRVIFRIVEPLNEVHVLTIRHGARAPLELGDIE